MIADSKSPPQRVLISGGLTTGGTQTHVKILCHVLLDSGADVTIAATATNWPSEAVADLKKRGVRVIVSPFGFGFFRILGKISALLTWPWKLRRNYDVLYCIGHGRTHLWASRFVRKGGWKIYHEIVECPSPGSSMARVAAKMDAIVANSTAVEKEINRLFPKIPTRTIPFFTFDHPTPAPPQPVFSNDHLLRIAYLGRLVLHKRPDHLIEAWPHWNAHSPVGPSRLDLYGGDITDDLQKKLQLRIDTLGLEESIRLHGNYPNADLPGILKSTDMVVLPSLYEGLPLVLVEAMQRGIPVVATSAGGTAELGQGNPDVIITAGTDWPEFEAGVKLMAHRLRSGQIDSARLHKWTESRYGFESVTATWRKALFFPGTFFA